MSDVNDTFFTAVGCMDGRVQDPVAEFGRKKFGAKRADTITEAGLVGQLARKKLDTKLIESIKFKVFDVSVGKHHSKGIIVHGHQECAGNPVHDDLHKQHVVKATQVIKSLNSDIEVIGVFVVKKNGEWKAVVVS